MQIDFHHAVTYVISRIAGMNHEQADIVAYSAQYVDDATDKGTIEFENGAKYTRISSAHSLLDARDVVDFENRMVYIPFHFLPGNSMNNKEGNNEKFINRLVCKPNSTVAKTMVSEALNCKSKPYGLHRLGITLHVYADTWAHQGFAGVTHRVNEVDDSVGTHGESNLMDWLKMRLADDVLPALGHARALTLPDFPFLKWSYRNGVNNLIRRDNLTLFMEAAGWMCKAVYCYIHDIEFAEKNYTLLDNFIEENNTNFEKIKTLLQGTGHEKGEERHKIWLEKINHGYFGFAMDTRLSYGEENKKSWRSAAIGEKDLNNRYKFKDEFLKSNWKMFHDGLQAHRYYVINELLPQHGICVG